MDLSTLCQYDREQRKEGNDASLSSFEEIPLIGNGFTLDFEKQASKRMHGQNQYTRALQVPSTSSHHHHHKSSKQRTIQQAHASAVDNTKSPSLDDHMFTGRSVRGGGAGSQQKQALGIPSNNHFPNGNTDPAEAFKAYQGDFFGTRGNYLDGLLYRSRMKKNIGPLKKKGHTPTLNAKELQNSLQSTNTSGSNTTSGKNTPSDIIEKRKRLAETIANWSENPANAPLMISEGVLDTLVSLCGGDNNSSSDNEFQLSVFTAIKNLSAVPECRSFIVNSSVVEVLGNITNTSEDVQSEFAMILCYLTNVHGAEEKLVASGAISFLSFLISLNESKDGNISVRTLCEWGMFNLSVVSKSYLLIENVGKSFISLGTGGNPSQKLVCASALYNLSLLEPNVRLKLVEDGLVPALGSLVRSLSCLKTRHLLALVAYNVSTIRNARNEMVTKGVVSILISIASSSSAVDSDTNKIKHIVAATLSNLCQGGVSNVARIVSDGGLSLLLSIVARQDNNDHTIRHCATAIYALSSCEENRIKLVESNGVKTISEFAASKDTVTAQVATLTMCNLLTVESASSEILEFGAVRALVSLCMKKDCSASTRRSCAAAFFTLASGPDDIAYKVVDNNNDDASCDVLSCIASLCEDPSTKMYCVASLYTFACRDRTRVKMANKPAVIKCLVSMLESGNSTDTKLLRYVVTTLCLLAKDETPACEIIKAGALPHVITASVGTDDMPTKSAACAMIASMTSHVACRATVIEQTRKKLLPALFKLATIKDPVVASFCAVALGNLSNEEACQEEMLELNIVSVLSLLSNSYSEDNQRHCAQTLANLSSHSGYEAQLVNQGCVDVLLMIVIVRAVNVTTKENCVIAFVNLLKGDTMSVLLDAGLIQALTSLASSHPTSKVIPHAVATCFYMFVNDSDGRAAVCNKPASLRALFAMLQSTTTTEKTKKVLSSILGTLLHFDDSLTAAIENGAVPALLSLTSSSPLSVSHSLLHLSKEEPVLKIMLSQSGVSGLLTLLKSKDQKVLTNAVYSLENIAAQGFSSYLDDIVPSIIKILITRDNTNKELLTSGISILCYLCSSLNASTIEAMLNANIIAGLKELDISNAQSHILPLATLLLRDITATKATVAASADDLVNVFTNFVAAAAFAASADDLVNVFTNFVAAAASVLDDQVMINCAEILCNITESAELRSVLATCEDFVPTIKILLSSKILDVSRRCAVSLRVIATSSCDCRSALVSLGITTTLNDLCKELLQDKSDDKAATLRDVAATLVVLARDTSSRAAMKNDGAMALLISLSETRSAEIEEYCTQAIAYLSTEGGGESDLKSGTVSALIQMNDRDNKNPTLPIDNVDFNSLRPEIVRKGIVPSKLHEDISELDISNFPLEKLEPIDTTSDTMTTTTTHNPQETVPRIRDVDVADSSFENSSTDTIECSSDGNADEILSEKITLEKVDPASSLLVTEQQQQAVVESKVKKPVKTKVSASENFPSKEEKPVLQKKKSASTLKSRKSTAALSSNSNNITVKESTSKVSTKKASKKKRPVKERSSISYAAYTKKDPSLEKKKAVVTTPTTSTKSRKGSMGVVASAYENRRNSNSGGDKVDASDLKSHAQQLGLWN